MFALTIFSAAGGVGRKLGWRTFTPVNLPPQCPQGTVFAALNSVFLQYCTYQDATFLSTPSW